MKVFAFAATNHKQSINKQLLEYTVSVFQENADQEVDAEIVDLVDYELPLFRQDREEQDGIPAKVKEFYNKIGDCDVLIISFAEHNGGYTAVYKNLFDWMSRMGREVFQNKPTLIMATSPGARGGASVLSTAEQSAPFFAMDIKAKVSVPSFNDNFDSEENRITNGDLNNQIIQAVRDCK